MTDHEQPPSGHNTERRYRSTDRRRQPRRRRERYGQRLVHAGYLALFVTGSGASYGFTEAAWQSYDSAVKTWIEKAVSHCRP